MNILIEDAETHEYLAQNGRWTKDAAKGRNCEGTGAAYEIAKREPIGHFNIVRYFEGSEQMVNLNHGKGKGKGSAPAE